MNVLFYVLDSARADHVSCYGYDRTTTPCIDSLAADGVRFERCISPATWTRPVAASILSGLYPSVHGTRTTEDLFDPPVPTLPEALSECGYATVGFESMPNVSSEFGYDQGFDQYYDLYEWDEIVEQRPDAPQFDDGTPLTRAADLNTGFEHWFEHSYDRNQPFFALVWSNEPHIPFSPPPDFRDYLDPDYEGSVPTEPSTFDQSSLVESATDRERLIDLYDCELRYNDHCIEELLGILDDRGVYDQTMVVVVGDHGEAFWEHDVFGHGISVPPYSEAVHVPAVIRHPTTTGGEHFGQEVSLVDLYPTILDCAIGEKEHERRHLLQGESLAGALTDEGLVRSDGVFSETYHEQEYGVVDEWYAVEADGWKYITFEPGDRGAHDALGMAGRLLSVDTLKRVLKNPLAYFQAHVDPEGATALYDLRADPAETESLLEQRPDERERLTEHLEIWREECLEMRRSLGAGRTRTEIDESMRSQLEQLGYLS